jgi:hypothetical protein
MSHARLCKYLEKIDRLIDKLLPEQKEKNKEPPKIIDKNVSKKAAS